MKEKLKNSLQNLSNSVDELSQKILQFKTMKSKKSEEELEFYKMRDERFQAQVDNLRHSLAVEKDRVQRAVSEIKDLTISLKNKMNKF